MTALPPEPAPSSDCSAAALSLAARLRQEQWQRWQQGQRPRLRDYLAAHPALAGHTEVVLGLILDELALRERAGEEPAEAEYLADFPQYAEALRGLFAMRQQCRQELQGLGGPASSEAETVPPGPRPEADAGGAVPATRAPSAGPAPVMPLPAAERVEVAGYEVLGVLGRGGMGVVYQARQIELDRVVALKMIRYAEDAGPEELERFRSEAVAIARLQHPGIVQIYEVGECQGRPCFALEYCGGGSLDRQLDGTPWEARRAARLVEALAAAVAAAHRAGIVHRDLKPGNVLLAADGKPKVTDFGLARRLDTSGQTRTGAILGTPSYMAPEQAEGKGKQAGPAADVYALGAILYELLVGRPPFKAATDLDTLLQVLSQEPVAVRRLQPQVPKDLETVCHKCLEKDPKRRYASAEALAEELRRFGAGEPVAARPVGPAVRLHKWARRRPALAALVVLAALALAGVAAGALMIARQAEQGRQKEEGLNNDMAKRTEQYLNGLLSVNEKAVQAGRFDEAIDALTAALELRPGHARASELLRQARVGQLLATAKANCSPDKAPIALQALAELRKLGAENGEARALEFKLAGYTHLLDCTGPEGVSADGVQKAQKFWAQRLGCEVEETVEIKAGVKMTFVLIPPGKFLMGSPAEEKGRSGDEKLHEVTLTEPYYLGKTEVTQAQYEAIMGENPSEFKGADKPVEQVDWFQATTFAEKLTKKRGDKHLYRLPTEAEWEYACRGGRSSSQPFGVGDGRALSSRHANFNGNFPYGGADKGPSLQSTREVGSYPANALGLHDMHGNVWEWCADWYAQYPAGPATDPTGPSAEGSSRVLRGGSWYSYASYCRAADRIRFEPEHRLHDLGARLARSVPSGSGSK